MRLSALRFLRSCLEETDLQSEVKELFAWEICQLLCGDLMFVFTAASAIVWLIFLVARTRTLREWSNHSQSLSPVPVVLSRCT